MNPEELKSIIDFLSKFYIWEIIIIGVAIGLTMIFKLPIKKHAYKLQTKYGVDKSMLTWITALIPYVLCFIMIFVLYWYRSGFTDKFDSLEWAAIMTETGLLGSGAVGLYEAIKKFIKGAKAIHEKKELQKAAYLKEQALKNSNSKYRIQKKEEK